MRVAFSWPQSIQEEVGERLPADFNELFEVSCLREHRVLKDGPHDEWHYGSSEDRHDELFGTSRPDLSCGDAEIELILKQFQRGGVGVVKQLGDKLGIGKDFSRYKAGQIRVSAEGSELKFNGVAHAVIQLSARIGQDAKDCWKYSFVNSFEHGVGKHFLRAEVVVDQSLVDARLGSDLLSSCGSDSVSEEDSVRCREDLLPSGAFDNRC